MNRPGRPDTVPDTGPDTVPDTGRREDRAGHRGHRRDVPLAPLTTLRLGGPAARLVEATDEAAIVAAVRTADTEGTPVLLLGGGSNLVLADTGWPGLVVLLRSRGVRVEHDVGRVLVEAAAGEPWDDLVARTVAEGWSGLECLAGIPGLTGATPVQNVGAYGQEVAETIRSVRVLDRDRGEVATLDAAHCGFAYRQSIFKGTERYVVLAVTFAVRPGGRSTPVRYAELARTLDVPVGGTAPVAAAREAVLALRRGKGMVLEPDDHDTWSAGSFFTNPVLRADELDRFEALLDPGTDYPHWPVEGGGTKLSAAWLIQHAGFDRGYRRGPVSLSTKHTLALTNRGGASTADLLGLARELRDGVAARFGVTLRPEPLLVGVAF